MGSLIYAPQVTIYIRTASGITYDVTDDVTAGRLERRSDGVSTAAFTLQNARRKYDEVFTPNDRVIILMKRLAWMRVFTGYLNKVPLLSIWPTVVNLTASCTLKRAQYWFWNPMTQATQTMIASAFSAASGDASTSDGGAGAAALAILNNVMGWPPGKAHIGAIPTRWLDIAYKIAQQVQSSEGASDRLAAQFYSNLTAGGIIGGVPGGPAISGVLKGSYGPFSGQQLRNAETIYSVGVSKGASLDDITVALMVSMAGASLNNAILPNAQGYMGLFRQKPSDGWGTFEQLLNPTYAASAFYGALLAMGNRSQFTPASQAQQVSKIPNVSDYASFQDYANQMVSDISKAQSSNVPGPTSPLPRGLNPNSRPTGTSTGADFATTAVNFVQQYPTIPYTENFGGTQMNIISASPPPGLDCCLVPETLIQTTDGPVRIADIKPGQMAYTWNEGKISTNRILGVSEPRHQMTYRLRTNRRSVEASANHPFLVVRKDGPGAYTPDWVQLRDLKRGDVVVTLKSLPTRNGVEDEWLSNPDYLWLLGACFGDGTLSRQKLGRISLCLFGERREEAQDRLERLIGKRGTQHPTHGIAIHHQELYKALSRHGMADYSTERMLPSSIWGLSHEQIDRLLAGYAAADGSVIKENVTPGVTYMAANPNLIKQVRNLHMILGHSVTVIRKQERLHPITIKGKLVKNARPLWRFNAYTMPKKGTAAKLIRSRAMRELFEEGHFLPETVKSLTQLEKRDTYDIEVEGAHNFIAEGIVVHNSSFVQAAYLRALGSLYDCPRVASDQSAWCTQMLTAAQGLATPGALMFKGPGKGIASHVEVSLGDGHHTVGSHHSGTYASIGGDGAGYWDYAGLPPRMTFSIAGGAPTALQLAGDAAGASGTGSTTTSAAAAAAAGAAGLLAAPNPTPFSSTPGYNPNDRFDALFGDKAWVAVSSYDATNPDYILANSLSGARALLDDQPLLPYLKQLFTASMRSFSSAPNGDLIAWFPDYYGLWGTAPVMTIEAIECQSFAVDWSDDYLVTHQFTSATPGVGAGVNTFDPATGSLSGTGIDPSLLVFNSSVASIDIPAVMYALFGLEATDADAANFAAFIYRRFGARPDYQAVPGLVGPSAGFFAALYLFMRQWAFQYSATMPLTWMPEVWPGMLLQAPWADFQCYVNAVTHTWQSGKDGYFRTDVNIAAPARMPKANDPTGHVLLGLPLAGGLAQPVTPSPIPSNGPHGRMYTGND